MRAVLQHWAADLGWQIDVLIPPASATLQADAQACGANPIERVHPKNYQLCIINSLLSLEMIQHFSPHVPVLVWAHEGEPYVKNMRMPLDTFEHYLAQASHIVFQSEWQRDRILHPFFDRGFDRVTVLPNGVPDIVLAPLEDRDKKTHLKRIVYFGGLYPLKRPLDLLEAIEKLAHIDVEVIVIGAFDKSIASSPRLAELLAKHLGKIRFTGLLPRPQALAHLSTADCFCSPSESETQGLAALEAASLGIPAVLSDLPSYAGMWRHRENCLLYPVGDINALSICLQSLLTNVEMSKRIAVNAQMLAEKFRSNEFFRCFDLLMTSTARKSTKDIAIDNGI